MISEGFLLNLDKCMAVKCESIIRQTATIITHGFEISWRLEKGDVNTVILLRVCVFTLSVGVGVGIAIDASICWLLTHSVFV